MKLRLVRYSALGVFLLSGALFLASFLPGYYLSRILGTHVSARISIPQLLRGTIKLEDVFVFSSKDYLYGPALSIKEIEIKKDPRNSNLIDSIHIVGIGAMRIYDAKFNDNLEQIEYKLRAYLESHNGTHDCQVKEIVLSDIQMKVYYMKDRSLSSAVSPEYKTKNVMAAGDSAYNAILRAAANVLFYKLGQTGSRSVIEKASSFFGG